MKLLKDDNRDLIVAYLKDPEGTHNLTDKQKQLLDYYVDAYTLFRNYTSIPDTITILVRLSGRRGDTISKATARRYLYDALDIFGAASETKKEAIKHIGTEIILDAIAIAREDRDAKAMIAGVKELAALNDTKDSDMPDFAALEPHIYQINVDKNAMHILQQLVTNGPVDLESMMGNMMNELAEDAKLVE